MESRESLNDSYREHSLSSQEDALDAEASAYEQTMTKMVEGMRTSLQEATADMDTFLNNVTIAVSMNANTVLEKYKETNVYLDPALTNPWKNAKTKVGEYGNKATNLMDVWKKDGYFAEFSSTAGTNLSSPWSSGTTAANTFKNSVSLVMSNVVSNIATNVKTASGELSRLYQQIIETEARAANANVNTGSGTSGGSGGGAGSRVQKKYYTTATLKVGSTTLTATASDPQKSNAEKKAKEAITGKYQDLQASKGITEERYENSWQRTYRDQVKYDTQYYAKGTTGATRDEWAIVDELGPELIMHANPETGRLEYLTKGSSVIPHDATVELMKLADLGVHGLMDANKFGTNINMISNAVVQPKYDFNFDSLVHVDHCDQSTVKDLEKMVDNKINDFSKALNYSLKRFAR